MSEVTEVDRRLFLKTLAMLTASVALPTMAETPFIPQRIGSGWKRTVQGFTVQWGQTNPDGVGVFPLAFMSVVNVVLVDWARPEASFIPTVFNVMPTGFVASGRALYMALGFCEHVPDCDGVLLQADEVVSMLRTH